MGLGESTAKVEGIYNRLFPSLHKILKFFIILGVMIQMKSKIWRSGILHALAMYINISEIV